MLSINTIARVIVNTVRASAPPASFDTGLMMVLDQNYAAGRRLKTYTSAANAAAGLVEMGFTTSSEAYKAAMLYFAASPTPSRLLFSCHPSTESKAEALETVLNMTGDFYGVMTTDTMTGADWLEFAQAVEAESKPLMLFVPITGTVTSATAADGILDKLYKANLKRVLPFYCSAVSHCAAVMGTAMGLELSHKDSAFALCYKTIQGIQPSGLYQDEVDALKALNCNVYVARGYTHNLLEQGNVCNGMRYDEVLYVDKIADELQNAAVTLLADNPDKLPPVRFD